MDSLTQFVLGAGIGAAVLGRRIGLRRAALTGGLLGTLPDLDVLLPNGDPVERFVGHRGPSHSLIVQTLATPAIGEGLHRLFAGLRDRRLVAYAAVFLCLTTHALLDAMTVYGTRLLWPLWPEPVGLGSVFIIDPLYTLPLLAVTVWALMQREWSPAYGRGLAAALAVSTAYLGWSAAAQQWASAVGLRALAERGVRPQAAMATPTAFNTLFWRVIAVDGPRYYNIYVPLLGGDGAATAYAHERWPAALGCGMAEFMTANRPARKVARFADGFYRLRLAGDSLEIADLRMGLPGSYVFRFAVAERDDSGLRPVPPRRVRSERALPGDLDWLRAGLAGDRAIRLAERPQLIDKGPRRLALADTRIGTC